MPDRVTAFAPGRVNLIGEHTDYNDGLALPFAISEGVTVRATALTTPRVEARAADLGETDEFALHNPAHARGWRAFVRGAVGELQGIGVDVPGARLEIGGNLPRGAGLSSSAALEVALALALIGLAGVPEPDRIALAQLCSRVENDWVGAQTGLLDQLASLFGRDNRALRIDFRALSVEPVALELGGYRLVTLDSGESHANAASGYNERRAECVRACEELGLSSLRDATEEMAATLPAPLSLRARHVVTENARVEATVAALARQDLAEVGRLLDASHASLRDCYEISTPAVEAAIHRLRVAGAVGARIVGGGFGGHVLGLMPPEAGVPDGAIEVRPGPGAHLVATATT
ncbi:MAG TPA: galactokinase [Solirubrobacteraceae bacterium]|nr:galactokinase [Solirubrobacteraceae bacterium]